MRFVLFTLLAAIPLIEIALLVQIGKSIGVWWTIALVVGTAVAGTYVLHRQGFALMNRVVATMAAGKPPVAPVIDGGFLMMAGMLLITPGLITDAMGLLLLVPQIRHRVAAWSVRKMFRSMTVRTAHFKEADVRWPGEGQQKERPGRNGREAQPPGEGEIIEGEFERLGERNIDPRRGSNGEARRAPPDDRTAGGTRH